MGSFSLTFVRRFKTAVPGIPICSGDHTVTNDPEGYYKESGHKTAFCAHFMISDWFITSQLSVSIQC